MNNKIKKSIVGLLAVSTAFSGALATATLVAPDNNIITSVNAKEQGHITIRANVGDNGEVQSLVGKKFNVYKIFDAENSAGMESINYTMNPEYAKALKKVTGKDTEYSIIDYIQTMNNNTVINNVEAPQLNESRYSNFRYFIENLRNMLVADKAEPTQVITVPASAKESYTLDVPFGWYVIDEITNVVGEHSASSLCMVNTANPNVFINIKSDFPVIQKQIREDDLRTSVGKEHDGWNDVGDYEIGQTVPYRYLTYVPNMNGYSSYYFSMHDRMDEALTFNPDSVVIKVGDKTLVNNVDYKIVTSGIPTDETFQIQIMDLKATINKYFYPEYEGSVPEMEKFYGQKIVVEYNATLNENAQLDTGRPGFENDVKLEYSNNPDSDGAGHTGETPWDTVVCFTFRMDGIKVNDQNPEVKLEGAKFRLYSDSSCTKEVYVKEVANGDGYTVINRDSVKGDEAPAEAIEMISDEDGIFNIVGLDSQTYYLKETKAPAGYRLLKDPIRIVVKATYDEDNRDNYIKGDGATDKTLQKLEATAHFKEFYSGKYSEYDNNLTTDVENGTLNIKVVNKVGSKLPATGSTMTVILVGAGTAMMATALIKRKKKINNEY
ncbi:MAG: isopeptide-forming domain-containing fimbrial protein [Erysipelotrichales bacterium]|uniref:isopeptide-forming domain-containing fimbrial protein n=1 Tax=Thomasclavelia cocleata TaxID=69824 RepID=UPI0023D5AD24|nr:isopeptide-forming domain-containing fimbrial protein [Thomasclavelia cocleata]MDE6953836.1 isopeptide-forming domain-containing fimbrial protein [Erysipelotrichales bacterium]